ncbi:hypothetical protein [Azospirillum sp. B2RO_4]|uniref:hypothetical protein n=1 Tax=Azospirillum sp. B2RO_4 TaxID=3027796 RepID=UPI003DA87C83
MLPKSNIALLDVGGSVKIRLILEPIERAAFLRYLSNWNVVALNRLENHAHALPRLNPSPRHFRLNLSGFDIFKHLPHACTLTQSGLDAQPECRRAKRLVGAGNTIGAVLQTASVAQDWLLENPKKPKGRLIAEPALCL